MDIEELNKFQLVLLTLLVSFVTSIATGIVTVTLLNQAPSGVTETINHVVERTIQTVLPDATSTPQTVTKETVVVKQDDLITSSIQDAMGKTARIFSSAATTSSVVGLGALVSPTILITDDGVTDGDHLVSFGSGASIFSVIARYPDIGITVLGASASSTPQGTPFKVADAGSVKLGGTAIAIVSVTNARVSMGSVAAVASLADVAPSKGAKTTSVREVDTNIGATLVPGTPLIDLFGNLVGISTSASSAGGFVAASDIIGLLSAPKATSTPAK